jgi:hypothetical protein
MTTAIGIEMTTGSGPEKEEGSGLEIEAIEAARALHEIQMTVPEAKTSRPSPVGSRLQASTTM